MRVLITGGSGFIGSNLCRRLLADDEPFEVSVLDDLSTGTRENLDGVAVDLHVGSILDDDQLDRAADGCDAIVHLAALGSVPRSVAEPQRSHEVNATGTVRILEAARRHGGLHTLFSGSSSVYGSNPQLPKHEGLATRPMSPYGASKLAAEASVLAWGATYELPVLSFRFFNVFGPLQPAGHAYAAVIPSFIDNALQGRPVEVHGDGEQSRDFTYVDTVTATLTDALRRRVTSDIPVNLAFGSRVPLTEVLSGLEELIGRPIPRRHTDPRPGDIKHSQADNTRLRSLFPDIDPTNFGLGLSNTVDWMRSQIPD